MAGPILYIAEVDYPAEHAAHHGKWNDWYAHRHAPDLFKLGARSVSSYRPVVGGLAALNVYEIPDSAVFKSAEYAGMTPKDPYAVETRELSAGRKRAQTLYLERVFPGDGRTLDADWISVLRFGLPASDDAALIEWVRDGVHKRLAALGAKHVRVGMQIADRVGAGTFRPRCVVFAEWARQPAPEADLMTALKERFPAATEAEPFVGYRVYPWPDVKRR